MTDSAIKFIVGLGNIGEKYENTPHNMGRELVDKIRKEKNLKWQKELSFEFTEGFPSFVRLDSFMNLSGKPVSELLKKFHCAPDEMLVCCDDFSLSLGMIRIRKKGSAGGHNGLQSIIEYLQTDQFPRVRLGIGIGEGIPSGMTPELFVLSKFSKTEKKTKDETLEKAHSAVESILSEGLDAAMNKFNERKKID